MIDPCNEVLCLSPDESYALMIAQSLGDVLPEPLVTKHAWGCMEKLLQKANKHPGVVVIDAAEHGFGESMTRTIPATTASGRLVLYSACTCTDNDWGECIRSHPAPSVRIVCTTDEDFPVQTARLGEIVQSMHKKLTSRETVLVLSPEREIAELLAGALQEVLSGPLAVICWSGPIEECARRAMKHPGVVVVDVSSHLCNVPICYLIPVNTAIGRLILCTFCDCTEVDWAKITMDQSAPSVRFDLAECETGPEFISELAQKVQILYRGLTEPTAEPVDGVSSITHCPYRDSSSTHD